MKLNAPSAKDRGEARGPRSFSAAQSDRRSWVLLGLAILVILGFAFTVPTLYVSLVHSGFLPERMPQGAEGALLVGLLGLTVLFCLYMIHQQGRINAFRRRLISDQMELEQSRGRLGEIISLFQLGGSLQMDLPLQTVAEITVRRVAATFHATEATMFVVDLESKTLRPKAMVGLVPGPPESEVPLGEGALGWVARHREPILMQASERSARFADFFQSHPEAGSVMILPVTVQNRCAAVLQICRGLKAEPFRLEHRDAAQLFANSVGSVIERGLVAERLDRKAAETTVPGEAATVAEAGFRDAFLSAATVELKAPITTVVAYSEVLDSNDQRLTPTMRREFTGRLRGEAQRLMGLVDDVLDVVRLEMGRFLLDLRKENVNRIARAAVDQVRGAAASRGVAIEISLDEKIPDQLLDATKLRQGIVRLLQNGVRFSPPKGHVAIATWMGDDHVLIEIRDGGPQVEPEEADRVFDLEAVGRGRSRRAKDGMGFGLHLTKRFVELHGGEVGVGPGPTGAGATFWVRLPRGEAQADVFALHDPFAEQMVKS
jgi:signal transduction histidine kinase